MTTLYTIGYEGSELAAFLSTLEAAGVKHVADVRDMPISRKKGFSKNKLAEALDQVGISYSHFKELGDPKEGRDAMRSGDHARFLEVFDAHISRDVAQSAMEDLADQAVALETVLLCYERDPKFCHRAIVATLMRDRGMVEKVSHLGVRK